jgi:hypothetical protein
VEQVSERIESALRRAHPTGRYYEPALSSFDSHLRASELRELLRRARQLSGARVEADELNLGDRSHVWYVSLDDGPTWQEFNRMLEEPDRVRLLKSRDQPLIYWIIRLSRLGPFWCGHWNEFSVNARRAIPSVVSEPRSWEWTSAASRMRDVLASNKLEEIDYDLLSVSVPWLTLHDGESNRPHSVRRPSLYEALFADLC